MMSESELRIQQAIQAYEAASGAGGWRVPFEVGGKQAAGPDDSSKYWDDVVEHLEGCGLPVPDVENLAFLDLGGGSDQYSMPWEPGDPAYTPFLARYMAALGAPCVVNVDIGPQNPEFNDVYTHLQLALSDRDDFSLPEELEKRGQLRLYDIIFTAVLVDENNPSPSLDSSIAPGKLKHKIKEWAKALLKPGGYLFFNGGSEGYMLVDGELVNIDDVKKNKTK